jgi:hypothetical protein
MRHENRESWLNYVAGRMAPMFASLDAPLPDRVRISIGFTSAGNRGRRIGECWDNRLSEDGHFEIFIVPNLAESPDMMPLQVAAILAHELVHAAVGIPAGHGKLFRRVAKGIGLEGKMTATVSGPKFEAAIAPILVAAGPLPHGRLNSRKEGPGDGEGEEPKTTGPKKQTKRHIKCKCRREDCGYIARTSRKWLDKLGAPHCPQHGQMEVIEDETNEAEDD